MICYVLAMGKQHLEPTWLWDTALKCFGWAFSLHRQITWRSSRYFVDSLWAFMVAYILRDKIKHK